jgi:thiol:disulfide interchange protein
MKPIIHVVLAVLCIPAFSAFGQPAAPTKAAFQSFSYDEALGMVRREKGKIVMIDFGATWCGPCKMMESTTFQDAQVKEHLADNLIAIKVDIDKSPDVANKHKVKAVPTILFLNGEGKEIERIVGYRNAQQFMQAARRIKAK